MPPGVSSPAVADTKTKLAHHDRAPFSVDRDHVDPVNRFKDQTSQHFLIARIAHLVVARAEQNEVVTFLNYVVGTDMFPIGSGGHSCLSLHIYNVGAIMTQPTETASALMPIRIPAITSCDSGRFGSGTAAFGYQAEINTRALELRPPAVSTTGPPTLELHAPMRAIGRERMAAGCLQASSAAAERLSQMFATTSPPLCPDIF